MAQPLATTAIRTAKDTRPTVDVEASSRHCLDDAVHGCILRSSLLKAASPISVRITRAIQPTARNAFVLETAVQIVPLRCSRDRRRRWGWPQYSLRHSLRLQYAS